MNLVEYLEQAGFDDDEIGEAIDIIAAADERWLQKTRGYPKDNEMLPEIEERLEDPQWLEALKEEDPQLWERFRS